MEASTPRLVISLLGPLHVLIDGHRPAEFTSDKVRDLLAYLAAQPERPHRREMLAGLLWPESPERSARASLRNALARLRHAIDDHHADPPLLTVTYQTILFSPSSQSRLDIAEFERLLLQPPTDDAHICNRSSTGARVTSRLLHGGLHARQLRSLRGVADDPTRAFPSSRGRGP